MFSVCSINVNVNGNVDVNFAKYRNTTRVVLCAESSIQYDRTQQADKRRETHRHSSLFPSLLSERCRAKAEIGIREA